MTSPYTTQDGRVFSGDQYYSGGQTYSNTSVDIQGTVDDPIYQHERYGNFSYNIPVNPGIYVVHLHFAEIYWGVQKPGGPGNRVFNVDIEGQRVLSNFDILTETTPATVLIKTFPGISASDGTLNIVFTSVVNNAKISAIEILPDTGTTVLSLGTTGAAQARADAALVRSALMDLLRTGASSARAGLAALRRLEVIGIAAAGGDADLVTTALLPLAIKGTAQSISTALLARALTPEVLSRVATAAQAALFATRALITTARAITGSYARLDRTTGAALNLAAIGSAASASDLSLLRTMGTQVLARALTDAHFRAARTVVLEATDQAVSSLRTMESAARRLEVTSRAASALWAALTSSAATVLTAALVGRGLSDGEAHLLTTRLMESAGRIEGILLATQVLRRLLGVTGSVEAQLQADPTDVRALEAALSGAANSAMSLSRAVLGYVVPEAFTIHVPANPLYVRVPANPLYVRVPPKSYA